MGMDYQSQKMQKKKKFGKIGEKYLSQGIFY